MIALRRVCGIAAMAVAASAACGQPVPASAPLAKPAANTPEREMPSSTRAQEGNEGEEREVEKGDAAPPNDDDDDDSTQCRPSTGPPLDCARLPSGSSACMGQVLARRVCETVAPSLDPSIAGAWLTCMRQRVDKEHECDSGRIFDCGLKVIQRACVDGSEHAACAEIARNCSDFAPEITATVCEHALGAWKPERRENLLNCLRRACDVGDFGACLP